MSRTTMNRVLKLRFMVLIYINQPVFARGLLTHQATIEFIREVNNED